MLARKFQMQQNLSNWSTVIYTSTPSAVGKFHRWMRRISSLLACRCQTVCNGQLDRRWQGRDFGATAFQDDWRFLAGRLSNVEDFAPVHEKSLLRLLTSLCSASIAASANLGCRINCYRLPLITCLIGTPFIQFGCILFIDRLVTQIPEVTFQKKENIGKIL